MSDYLIVIIGLKKRIFLNLSFHLLIRKVLISFVYKSSQTNLVRCLIIFLTITSNHLPREGKWTGILSKYPLFNKGSIPFENYNNGAVYAEIIYRMDTHRIYNVHMQSLRISLEDTIFTKKNSQKFLNRISEVIRKQEVQMEKFQKIDQLNKNPSIICTDLNNNAFSKVYKGIKKNRIDAFSIAGEGLGTTYKMAYFPFRIDFIFVDPRMEVINFNTYSVKLSDHNPVSAVLNWK